MRLLPLLALALPLAAQSLPRPGDLAVSPTRLVFEGRSRTLELHLANVGETAATYRLGFLRLAMGEDGRLRQVPDLARSAEALLRFSPRLVNLAPGERQVVRVILRKPEVLAEGDHRIHLCFQAVPGAPPTEAPPEAEGGLHLQLTPVPAVSIPILVRQGTPRTAFQLEAVHTQAQQLAFTLVQTGTATLYGTLRASFQPLGGGARQELGTLEGFVHYVDLPRQRVTLPLKNPLPAGKGHLLVSLINEDTQRLAEAMAPLPESVNRP